MTVAFEILLVGFPGVVERVVDVAHRRCEHQVIHLTTEIPGALDKW
jgi:hypothetical protein